MTQFKGVCIGRKDKNGSPIFEGDYLRCCNGKTYRVVWRDDVLAFGIQCVDLMNGRDCDGWYCKFKTT